QVGVGKVVARERSLEPELTIGGKAVDANDLALGVRDTPYGGVRLDVKGGRKAARAFPCERCDDFSGNAFAGGEQAADRGARGKINGAGFKCLGALGGTLKARGVELVGLAVVRPEFGPGEQ